MAGRHLSEQEVERLVVSELSRNRARNDLIALVCDRTGLRWDAAQQLIDHVQSRNHTTIDRRNLILTLCVSVPIFLLGVFIFFGTIIGALQHTDEVAPGIPGYQVFKALAFGFLLMFGGGVSIFWRKRVWSRELLDRK